MRSEGKCTIQPLQETDVAALPTGEHQLYLLDFPLETASSYTLSPDGTDRSALFSPTQSGVRDWISQSDGYVISFDELFVNAYSSSTGLPPQLLNKGKRISPAIYRSNDWIAPMFKLCEEHQRILTLTAQPREVYSRAFGGLIINCLCDLLGGTVPWLTPRARLGKTVYDFLQVLEKDYMTHRRPGHYARAICVSESALLKGCQHNLAKSPTDIILQRVIKEAKRLLIESDLAIAEISDTLNFASPSYFAERFKLVTQVSPNLFRRLYVLGS